MSHSESSEGLRLRTKITSFERGAACKAVLAAAESRGAGEAEEQDAQDMRGLGWVLVVDDEEMVRNVVQLTLESAGHNVLQAADGLEAVELFRVHGQRITVVLLDLTMPRMGGGDTCREIRRIQRDAKVILSSGFNEQEAVNRFGGQALAGFLQKPFLPRELLEAVHDALVFSR